MIEKMHEKSNGIVFKIIFGLVSVSFVLGGIGGGLMMNQDTSAVKVNGEEVSQQQFAQAKSREQSLRNEQEGKRFWEQLEDPQFADAFHHSVLNRLIGDTLLRQYARDLNLGISVEQIKAEIVNSPHFQQDGKFNNSLYQQALRNAGINAEHYASIVGDGMLLAQLQEGILRTDFSVPAQQDAFAKLWLQSRQVRQAVYSLAEEAAKQQASEEEIAAFYAEHAARFTTPEKLTVEYVAFSQQALAEKIQVDDAQIETYYQTNKANYMTAAQTRLAHIQLADEATATQVTQALKNGDDFAKLAAEYSADKGSSNQGGDLGWAKAGTFPAEFEAAAAALAVGETSAVVKIDNAYHLIKVLDRQAESLIPLDNLKAQIRETIRQELIRSEYSTTIREMANKAFEANNSLTEVAQLAGVEVKTTDAFDAKHIPAVLNHDAVIQALFNSELRKNGQNSEAFELGNDTHPETLFVRVSHYEPETTQPLEQAKPAVEQAVKQEKAQKVLMARAQADLDALQKGETSRVNFGNPSEWIFAQRYLLRTDETKVIFAMPIPTDKPSYQLYQDRKGNVVIFALDKVNAGSPKDVKALSMQRAQEEQMSLYNNLLADLRERAKIEINEEYLQQQINDK